ncbi:MAG TPA: DUF4332 domain-containing protein [Synechococcales cyanobacterium M55_K2018_004]|nr:DUF4332 domain-containing protein [Synechococcales cyanobacterium M55_K2018_004]
MANSEHRPDPIPDETDDLELIDGIGTATAEALYEAGIRLFSDLAQHTPQSLSRLLHEQTDLRVSPRRIETEDWIGQAQELAEQVEAQEGALVEEPLSEETLEAVSPEVAPELAKTPPQWQQHASFSVTFDTRPGETGETLWQTRVVHQETHGQAQLAGISTLPWVSWILTQARLPLATELIPTTPEIRTPTMPATPNHVFLEILEVKVSEIESAIAKLTKERKLLAEVRFRLGGNRAEALTTQQIPYQVSVCTTNLQTNASNLVGTDLGHLQNREFEYVSRHEFPVPAVGRYECHSVVLLLPPYPRMEYYQGPILKVET